MPATIQPALHKQLEARALGPFDVVIEFAQLPSADELQALGLELDGASARGRLNREQILAIASFPQVRSIGLTDQPIAPRKIRAVRRQAETLAPDGHGGAGQG